MSRVQMATRRSRARRLRRLRGFLLSLVLLTALAVCTGRRVPSSLRQSRPEAGSLQPLQMTAALPAASAADASAAAIPMTDAPEGELAELVSGVLEKIVTDGMTPLEQARAVFDYVHDGITYTGSSDKSDWEAGAYEGLTTRKGDCFTYYAVSRALLTALGIDNLPVERTGGETHHFWNLVNCGGGWYHFDACPRSSKLPAFCSFMVTDGQVADFTAAAGRNYYDFDGSLLPARAAEIITGNE